MTTPSLAERAIISAQETVAGHSLSRASLMVVTYLKFLIPKLLSFDCSDTMLVVVSSSRDASQDCTTQPFQSKFHQKNQEGVDQANLDHAVMEQIPDPGHSRVAMLVVELHNLLLNNLLGLGAALGVVV